MEITCNFNVNVNVSRETIENIVSAFPSLLKFFSGPAVPAEAPALQSPQPEATRAAESSAALAPPAEPAEASAGNPSAPADLRRTRGPNRPKKAKDVAPVEARGPVPVEAPAPAETPREAPPKEAPAAPPAKPPVRIPGFDDDLPPPADDNVSEEEIKALRQDMLAKLDMGTQAGVDAYHALRKRITEAGFSGPKCNLGHIMPRSPLPRSTYAAFMKELNATAKA